MSNYIVPVKTYEKKSLVGKIFSRGDLTDRVRIPSPTFRKTFFHPATENGWTYALSGLKFVVSLFALESFTWTTALYPASLVLASLAFVAMLIWRKRTIKAEPAKI